jgi:hypothetical protein
VVEAELLTMVAVAVELVVIEQELVFQYLVLQVIQ